MATETATSILGTADDLAKDPSATDDFSKETDALLHSLSDYAQRSRIQEAIDKILVLEKKARQASDANSCTRLTCWILEELYKLEKFSLLNEYLVILCKKRAQLKKAIISMVHKCMEYLEVLKDTLEHDKLIQTLITITDGKIFVEVERARLTFIQAKKKEAEGKIEEAAQLLQEVQVETFGAMEKREKAEYVLEQMRLVLRHKDYVRCQIISKKINTKLILTDDFQDIKIKYYTYMIEYYLHENETNQVAGCYLQILQTPCINESATEWDTILKNYILYILLSPYETKKTELLQALSDKECKKLKSIPLYKSIIDAFLAVALFPTSLNYEEELKKSQVFTDVPYKGGHERTELFRRRIRQHNICVIGKYYSRITMKRLSELIDLDLVSCENEISELVTSKVLKARIDRPLAVVAFGDIKDTTDYLNSWSQDVSKMLELVEESSHLIQKEALAHSARMKQTQ